jgi:hypothetical protein
MRLLFRPSAPPPAGSLAARAFLLLSYLALSAVPFVPLLLGKPVDAPWQTLGMEVVAWVAVWAVFKRPAWFHWLLLPAFLALPTEVYLIVYYGQGISTHHLGIIAETSPMEAVEFLGRTVYLMAAVLAGVIAWFGISWYVAVKTRALAWSDSSRWVALGIVAALGCVAAYGWEFGVAGKPAARQVSANAAARAAASAPASVHASGFGDGVSAEVEDAEEEEQADSASSSATGAVAAAARTGWKLAPLAWWAKVPVDFAAFSNTWPFGLTGRGVDFYNERQHLAELGRTSSSFTFQARQAEGNG